MAGFAGYPHLVRACVLSFPHSGNGLSQPLDSSAFAPDAALPLASMQAGLRRNDGGGGADMTAEQVLYPGSRPVKPQ